MQKPLASGPSATALEDLGVLRAQGPDAVKFLQGQLSNDVTRLAAAGSMLAGLHNPQGRVVALLRLVSLAADDILMVLPRELAPAVLARLSKYVLRAKVRITDASAQWRVTGVLGASQRVPEGAGVAVRIADDPPRGWLVTPSERAAPLEGHARLDREAWRALDIASGLPQVYAATSEEFVAQMLNLDTLGAIAFDKGCYTGQEVIARAHYRGRVKRRLQFLNVQGSILAAGDSGTLPDGRGYKVVEAVADGRGGCDILAVAALTPGEDATESPATG